MAAHIRPMRFIYPLAWRIFGFLGPLISGTWCLTKIMTDFLGRSDAVRGLADEHGVFSAMLKWLLATPAWVPGLIAITLAGAWIWFGVQLSKRRDHRGEELSRPLVASLPPGKRYIPPHWDAPLIRVVGEHYKNETVELDGNQFMDCTFEDVSLRYQGERPFLVVRCTFASKHSQVNVQIFSDNPIVGQTIELFNVAGVLSNPGTLKVFPGGRR